MTPDVDPVPLAIGDEQDVPPRCCWCGGKFFKIEDHYWCETADCRVRQANFAVGVRLTTDGDPDNTKFIFLFVPLPKQVEFEECEARNLLGGGAAGSTKSHIARWSMYRRAIRIPNYEGLLIRRTWGELEKHHFRLMDREAKMFRDHGIPCEFSITKREMIFYDTGAIIEGGHMESQDDIDKYLSRERDDIGVDEGVTIPPQNLLELSTRARSTKRAVLDAGGARFRIYTNPGGVAAAMLRDFFITHEPNWEDYSPALKKKYKPAQWAYIPGSLEDNPYLPPGYQTDLAILQPWRYQQLRYNDWDVVAGTFFAEFATSTHVKDLGDPGEWVEWFMSLDWGYIKPGVVLWWACLADGTLYIRYELKFSHLLIEPLVEKIKEINEWLGVRQRQNLRYCVADPALKGADVNKVDRSGKITGESMQQTFASCGFPVMLGDNDRHQGWQRMHELLGNRQIQVTEDGVTKKKNMGPTIIIHKDCKYLIRCLASAVSAKHDPEDINMDDDHPLDSARYGAMSRPRATKVSKIVPVGSFNAHRKELIRRRKRLGLKSA